MKRLRFVGLVFVFIIMISSVMLSDGQDQCASVTSAPLGTEYRTPFTAQWYTASTSTVLAITSEIPVIMHTGLN